MGRALNNQDSLSERFGKSMMGGLQFGRGVGRAADVGAFQMPEVQGFSAATVASLSLEGKRLVLRPLDEPDYDAYRALLSSNAEHLASSGSGPIDSEDPTTTRDAFIALINDRELRRVIDDAHHYAVFAGADLVGEFALTGLVRGMVQSAFLEAWIGEAFGGHGYAPEAYVVLARHAFDDLGLHRIEAAVLPDNADVKAALAKIDIRNEGTSARYLCVNGEWRDHERYVLTAEEWDARRDDLLATWVN